MLKALFYIPAIMFLVAIISDVFLRVYLVRGRKLILDSNAFNSLSKMLNLKGYELDNHIIQQSKSHFYHPLKNCVGIKSFDSRAVSKVIPSLHEGGHYLSINTSIRKRKAFCVSQVIIALNRLLVIPLFLLLAFDLIKFSSLSSAVFLTILMIIFIVASFLRLFVGVYDEYCASQLAMNYINNNFDSRTKDYAIKFFIMSFLSQMFLSLTIIISISVIYVVLISMS